MNKSFLLILFAQVFYIRLLFGQSFTKITAANNPVVNDQFESGGGSWADFNNDNYLDLFVPNGNLNNQNNSLYLNDRQGNFVKIVTGAVVMDGGSSIGGTWGDFDNDGDLDLFVANNNQSCFLYQNSGAPDYAFTRITAGEIVNDLGASFGCAWADYDRDGDLDLFVANQQNQRNFLYANGGNQNAWLAVRCTGRISNPSAIGAKVRVSATINGTRRWQMQEVLAQTGYNSQNLELHFGLGDATIVDSIKIDWPSGATETFRNVAAKQFITITESGGLTSVTHPTETPAEFVLHPNFPNPFNPSTRIRFSLPNGQFVRLKVYDVLGHEVAILVEESKIAGTHEVKFEAASLRSGIYLLRLTAGSFVQARKMVLAR